MDDYLFPSTILDLNEFTGKIKNNIKNETETSNLNIIIVGGGPIGLFTALYLTEYYDKYYYIFRIKLNLILLDNRISEEKIKLPYSRLTQFGFDISEIQIFLKQIFCWNNKQIWKTRQFDFINILESMLYVCAFHYKVPMYFTKKYETFDDLKEFATNNNFNYIFDCSGGRLQPKFNNNINWNKYKFKKDNYEVKLANDNYYRFYVNDKLYEHYSVVLHLFDKNMKQFKIGNIFGFTNKEKDIELLKLYNNKCFSTDEYIKLSKHFEDYNSRYLYPHMLKMFDIKKDVAYIKLNYFISNSHHLDRCAQMINKDLMYIGLGNTLGTSEYGIYFGMKDSILLSKQICHLLAYVVQK